MTSSPLPREHLADRVGRGSAIPERDLQSACTEVTELADAVHVIGNERCVERGGLDQYLRNALGRTEQDDDVGGRDQGEGILDEAEQRGVAGETRGSDTPLEMRLEGPFAGNREERSRRCRVEHISQE